MFFHLKADTGSHRWRGWGWCGELEGTLKPRRTSAASLEFSLLPCEPKQSHSVILEMLPTSDMPCLYFASSDRQFYDKIAETGL